MENNKLLVHFHLHNFDLYEEIKTYIKNIERDYDMYVTMPINNEEDRSIREHQKTKVLQDFPTAQILIVQNIGADTVAFLDLLQYLKVNNKLGYKYLFKIHTKTDLTLRHELSEPIIGSKEIFKNSFEILEKDRVGMICCGKHMHHENMSHWEMKSAYELLQLANMNANGTPYFSGGTIFLCKFHPFNGWTQKVDIEYIIHNMYRRKLHKFIDLAYIVERLCGLLMLSHNLDVVGL